MRVSTRTIELAALADLQETLRSIPPRPETKVDYAKAIKLVAPEIRGMRSRGYGWDEIARTLSERGVALSVSTLRAYLRRVGGPAEEPSPAGKTKQAHRVSPTRSATLPAASPPPATQPARNEAKTIPHEARQARPVPAAQAVKPPPAPRTAESPHAAGDIPTWSFAVRPDTPDL